jgi:hypothetical protein
MALREAFKPEVGRERGFGGRFRVSRFSTSNTSTRSGLDVGRGITENDMEDLIDRVKKRRHVNRPAEADESPEDSSESSASDEESALNRTRTRAPPPRPTMSKGNSAGAPEILNIWAVSMSKLVNAFDAMSTHLPREFLDAQLVIESKYENYRYANIKNLDAQVALKKRGHSPDPLTSDIRPELPQLLGGDEDFDLYFTTFLKTQELGPEIETLTIRTKDRWGPEALAQYADFAKALDTASVTLNEAYNVLQSGALVYRRI